MPYDAKPAQENEVLTSSPIELTVALVEPEGMPANHKRVFHIYRAARFRGYSKSGANSRELRVLEPCARPVGAYDRRHLTLIQAASPISSRSTAGSTMRARTRAIIAASRQGYNEHNPSRAQDCNVARGICGETLGNSGCSRSIPLMMPFAHG